MGYCCVEGQQEGQRAIGIAMSFIYPIIVTYKRLIRKRCGRMLPISADFAVIVVKVDGLLMPSKCT